MTASVGDPIGISVGILSIFNELRYIISFLTDSKAVNIIKLLHDFPVLITLLSETQVAIADTPNSPPESAQQALEVCQSNLNTVNQALMSRGLLWDSELRKSNVRPRSIYHTVTRFTGFLYHHAEFNRDIENFRSSVLLLHHIATQ